MKRRFWIAFYGFNLLLYAAGSLFMAMIGIAGVVHHDGHDGKALFTVPGGIILCRFAYALLRRELRTSNAENESIPTAGPESQVE